MSFFRFFTLCALQITLQKENFNDIKIISFGFTFDLDDVENKVFHFFGLDYATKNVLHNPLVVFLHAF